MSTPTKYVIDLIRRGHGGAVEVMTSIDAEAKTTNAAIGAGHRAFKTRETELAEGFRVIDRANGKVVALWFGEKSR